jgi:hypothetical protein
MDRVRSLHITIFDSDDEAELWKQFYYVVNQIDKLARPNEIKYVIDYSVVRGGIAATVEGLDTVIAVGFVAELLSLVRGDSGRSGGMSFRVEWTTTNKA